MFVSMCIVFASLVAMPATAQTILSDPGTAGPPVEIVHLYQDEWPTGIRSLCLEASHIHISI